MYVFRAYRNQTPYRWERRARYITSIVAVTQRIGVDYDDDEEEEESERGSEKRILL